MSFAAGETSKTFVVVADDDAVDDDGESLVLGFGDLPAQVTAGAVATTTVNLADDDVPPLTASVSGAPATHDGEMAFTFQLQFSGNVAVGFQTLRDHAFAVTGGTVTNARRLVTGSNQGWEITIEPDSHADVTVVLPVTTDCAATGAVCTAEGTALSERVEVTVAGPAPQSPPPAPTNLTAEVNADGHIVLSWEAPADATITGYQILRRRPTEDELELLVYVDDTQSTATTYTDTNVTAGVRHVYRVKAINAAGLSEWSNYVNPTPEDGESI